MSSTNTTNTTKPHVLMWARESAGLSREEAAQASGISLRYLTAIERGKIAATRPQLSAMSEAYKRSIVCFYFFEPPQCGEPVRDLRTQVTARNMEQSHDVEVLIQDLLERHALLKHALAHEGCVPKLDWIGSTHTSSGAKALCDQLEQHLGLDRIVLRDVPTLEDAFLFMKQSMESLGIAVMISGHVSFHHAIMPARLYRSFSVIDPMLPVISINENLPIADWLFTMIHEMAHLLIGESGVEGLGLDDTQDKRIEMFCDDVAAEFLLPLADLQRLNIATLPQSSQLQRITEAATAWKVSPQTLAFRLFRAGLLSETVWRELFEAMQALWRQDFKVNREYVHEKLHALTEYDIRCLRLGPVLLNATERALFTRAISATEAGKVLGIQARKVAALLAHAYEARTS